MNRVAYKIPTDKEIESRLRIGAGVLSVERAIEAKTGRTPIPPSRFEVELGAAVHSFESTVESRSETLPL